MDQTPPPIRLARSGTFTSNEGVAVSFTEAMFAEIAAAYDRAADPAPLVIGHPKLDDPAYGWVDSLAVENGELVARPADVEPAFAEAVREKRYAKVSARFYPPEHAANPKPGVWYLKHIGFLGAHAPGIKGLGTVQFADGADEGAVTLDFSESEDNTMSEASFAERSNALDERERAIEAREQQARKDALAALHASNVSFAEGLIADAKLAPAGKGLLIGVLDQLDTVAVVSFGEAGEMAPAAALKKLLGDAVPLVSFAEHGKKPGGDKSYTSFAAPSGYEVDAAQAELHARATKIRQDHPELSLAEAVKRAQVG